MKTGWKVYTEYRPERQMRAIHLIYEDRDGSRSVATGLTMQKVPRHAVSPQSDGVLGNTFYDEADDFLRAVMDAAWEAGIRPTGFADHTNELTAVRYHLEDMRKLAKVK